MHLQAESSQKSTACQMLNTLKMIFKNYFRVVCLKNLIVTSYNSKNTKSNGKVQYQNSRSENW